MHCNGQVESVASIEFSQEELDNLKVGSVSGDLSFHGFAKCLGSFTLHWFGVHDHHWPRDPVSCRKREHELFHFTKGIWVKKEIYISLFHMFVCPNQWICDDAWSAIITPSGNPYLKPIYQPVQWIWSCQVWTQMCLELSCRERRRGFCHGIHVGKLHVWRVKLSLTMLMIPEKFTFFSSNWLVRKKGSWFFEVASEKSVD